MQVFAKLGDLVNEVKSAELISPTLIIIGNVVALSPFWPYSSGENMDIVQEPMLMR